MALVVKDPPASAGDVRDMGLIPRSGRSPVEEMATHSTILAGLAGYSPWGPKESDMTKYLSMHDKKASPLIQNGPVNYVFPVFGRQQKERVTDIFVAFGTLWGVQFICSVVSDSLQPHGLQHARLPCPSTTCGACSNSCPSSR